MKGKWMGVDAPDVLGVWTALEEVEDGAAGGGGGRGGDDGDGACVWAPFVPLGVAVDAMAVGGAALMLLLLPALVLPLLLPARAAAAVVAAAAALLAFPLDDLKEDKRFCAEDLRRIMGRRMDWESKFRGSIQHCTVQYNTKGPFRFRSGI
jgi:hypothetical protein